VGVQGRVEGGHQVSEPLNTDWSVQVSVRCAFWFRGVRNCSRSLQQQPQQHCQPTATLVQAVRPTAAAASCAWCASFVGGARGTVVSQMPVCTREAGCATCGKAAGA
jgi:hypothetical protein